MQVKTYITLKKSKDKAVRQRHHWIFSGAIEKFSSLYEEGDAAEVYSYEGEKLGIAFLHKGGSILAQMIAFGPESLEEALKLRVQEAISLRKRLFDPTRTNAFRLIHTEGDGLPGLIVDSYNGVLVMQISTAGMERRKDFLISCLLQEANPKAIFEKSTTSLRRREGLVEQKGHLYGEANPEMEVLENGLFYSVHVLEGQKTGLFLDQREMRAQVRDLSFNKKVLNCFSYTGGFSISALAAKACFVDSVDISAKCGPAIEKNIKLNGLPLDKHRFFAEDVMRFIIENPLDYDLIILDPPAFAKKRQDLPKASHAYQKLNRKVLEKIPSGALLLTCSCSSQIDSSLFKKILFKASLEAKRKVRILGEHRGALDHPVSIYHPEGSYLKSLLLEVVH